MDKMTELPKKIPVFPLSNFIIFPKTTVPLNIFEPRYIQMVDDCMKENRMIGMIQPRKSTLKIPELYDVGCVGKITSFNETDDGRYLIIINGISRFKILKEIKNLGLGADVVSKGEMMKALKARIAAKKIVFSGVGKTYSELKYAINKKILLINVESKSELLVIEKIAKLKKRRLI